MQHAQSDYQTHGGHTAECLVAAIKKEDRQSFQVCQRCKDMLERPRMQAVWVGEGGGGELSDAQEEKG